MTLEEAQARLQEAVAIIDGLENIDRTWQWSIDEQSSRVNDEFCRAMGIIRDVAEGKEPVGLK